MQPSHNPLPLPPAVRFALAMARPRPVTLRKFSWQLKEASQ